MENNRLTKLFDYMDTYEAMFGVELPKYFRNKLPRYTKNFRLIVKDVHLDDSKVEVYLRHYSDDCIEHEDHIEYEKRISFKKLNDLNLKPKWCDDTNDVYITLQI